MEAKKAEFAKFFERLINRASRKDYASMPPESHRTSAAPADLTLPTIQNHSSTVRSKDTSQQETRNGRSAGLRSSAVANPGLTTDDAISADLAHEFTVGRWYPFTFKMMVHKLYELEEWGKKVKEVLERSQKDFKPLSEVNWEKKASVDERPQGQVQFKLKQPEGRVKSNSIPGGVAHTRSNSFLGNVPSERTHHRLIAMQDAFASPKVDEGARIVKKRCVGRDKIFTGSAGMGEVKPQNMWVYKGSAMRQAVDRLQTQRNWRKKRHAEFEQCPIAGVIIP
ncbi:hypothetical protein F5887DRAFT_1178830 [Amanita rubescens]|nr:hypothetical protein F5887DRAFT_1178830 [Amanita rubescens]